MEKRVPRGEAFEGKHLGAYEIIRRVGSGATASVFEATHTGLGRTVAVKVLHEHLADDEQTVGRFLREGRVAARLRHPNIVNVVDVGSQGGIPYLVMDFLRGGTFRTLLAATHVLTVEQALDYLLPIAAALVHAHGAGVVHRDLKPANILLAEDRSEITPTLVDFGLSKAANAETDLTAALTSTELVAGTILYMSPEQTFGVKNASPASDQYSLATILYEAVTGEPPFMADGIHALIERIRGDAIKPPSLIHGAVPAAFDDVLLRAMNRKPEKRWPSVREFARELLPFASAQATHAVERELMERPSGSPRVVSRPALRVAAARSSSPDVETRPELNVEMAPAVKVAPLPVPPGQSPFHIKGNAYRGIVHNANRMFPQGLASLCEAIDDPAVRDFLRQPFLATGRYDLLPIVPATQAFAALMRIPLDRFVREGSVGQANYDARTIFRNVVAVRSTDEIGERISRLGTRFYDFGDFTGAFPEPGRLVLTHSGVPAYVLPWYEPMIASYIATIFPVMTQKTVTGCSFKATPTGKRGAFPLVSGNLDILWADK